MFFFRSDFAFFAFHRAHNSCSFSGGFSMEGAPFLLQRRPQQHEVAGAPPAGRRARTTRTTPSNYVRADTALRSTLLVSAFGPSCWSLGTHHTDDTFRVRADDTALPSQAERPLVPFFRPPLPPPELRPTAPVVGPKLPPRRRPQAHQHPMRCHPRSGGGGRHPHHFCRHPHGCGPAVATVAASPFPRFRSANSSSGVRPKDMVGFLVVGYQQSLN